MSRISSRLSSSSRVVAAAVVVAVSLSGIGGRATAKEAQVGPVPRYVETLEVAPGVEHRLVIVHPIVAGSVPETRATTVTLGGVASPDLLAIGAVEKSGRPHADALSVAATPAAVYAGDLLRTATADFAVVRTSLVPPGAPQQLHLVRVSHEIEPDPKSAEPAMLGPVLPSALRYLLLTDASPVALRDTCDKWAAEVHLATPRRSPAELGAAEPIAKRVMDYRVHFAKGLPAPAGAGREVVGCAVLLDGALVSVETYASGQLFASAWPRLLEGIAIEAAVQEVRENLLAEPLADPADPDRFLTGLKTRLLDVFGARTSASDVIDHGRQIEVQLDGAVANAFVLGDDPDAAERRVVHFVLVTDPSRRTDKPPTETPDPNAAARKARPTEEEKRLIERRKPKAPTLPPEPVPAPPPK